jgi:hypothetical protein
MCTTAIPIGTNATLVSDCGVDMVLEKIIQETAEEPGHTCKTLYVNKNCFRETAADAVFLRTAGRNHQALVLISKSAAADQLT